MYIHCTLIPYLKAAGEMKTKPTQHSVKELRSLGIQPNIIVVRTEMPVSQDMKTSLHYSVTLIQKQLLKRDADTLYAVPLSLQEQNMDQIVCDHLKLDNPAADMTEWTALGKKRNLSKKTKIALVGKYVELQDAYISVVEALRHAGYSFDTDVEVKWVNAEHVTAENVQELVGDTDGILVPGGFGDRGVEGKIVAIQYARENKVPFLGICLGMQLASIEFARNVLGLEGANSSEINPDTPYAIIDLLPEQKDVEDLGGTLRLGLYKLAEEMHTMHTMSRLYMSVIVIVMSSTINSVRIWKKQDLYSLVQAHGRLVEIIELKDHPWFVAAQFHPELVSRPNRPQPLFHDFVRASITNKESK